MLNLRLQHLIYSHVQRKPTHNSFRFMHRQPRDFRLYSVFNLVDASHPS